MKFLTRERVNLLIASCALIVSGLSFYATYLQADAAEKQVRAMTFPIVVFGNSNMDAGLTQDQIRFDLKNSGVGPASIEMFEIEYQENRYPSIEAFLAACCNLNEYIEAIRAEKNERKEIGQKLGKIDGVLVTSSVSGAVIPGQSAHNFLTLSYGEISGKLWDRLNEERLKIKVRTCYCSLLGNCFLSEHGSTVSEVKSCAVTK